MAIFGANPVEGENNSVAYERVMVGIKKNISDIVSSGKALSDPDNGFIACVYALRVLAEAEPKRAYCSIYKGQVQEWENVFFESLEKSKKLPPTFREGFLNNAKGHFEFLKLIGSDLPKDMW